MFYQSSVIIVRTQALFLNFENLKKLRKSHIPILILVEIDNCCICVGNRAIAGGSCSLHYLSIHVSLSSVQSLPSHAGVHYCEPPVPPRYTASLDVRCIVLE